MSITKLQQWVEEDWKHRSHSPPTLELQLLYLIEEVGEVAEAIRKESGKKIRKNNEVNLGLELADVIISVVTLANTFNIDLDKELKAFQKRLLTRHNKGF